MLNYYLGKVTLHSLFRPPELSCVRGSLHHCVTMLKGQRFVESDEDRECNMAAAEEAAEHLYNKGEGQWGTNEEAFIELLCACSPEQSKVG